MLPAVSTPIPVAASSRVPPRYVENTSADPLAFSFVTKASVPPAGFVWIALAVGRPAVACPATYRNPEKSAAIASTTTGKPDVTPGLANVVVVVVVGKPP